MSSSRADHQNASGRNSEKKRDNRGFSNDRRAENRDSNRNYDNRRENGRDRPRRFDSKDSNGSRFSNDRKPNQRFNNDRKQNQRFQKPNQKFNRDSKPKKDTQALVQPHPAFPGIFTMRTRGTDALLTKSLNPGVAVYGEKLVTTSQGEFRMWSATRSKLAAGILKGLDAIHIAPSSTVLYLGAASGTSVSHVSDIVGENGIVYAVEFSSRSARDLVSLARKRPNIIPIVCDARHPWKYRMLVPPVDTIFSDVAQPDQARIVSLNAAYFLKVNGGVVVSIKANCVDCTRAPSAVYADEVDRLRRDGVRPREQVDLDPYEKDHAMVVGVYKPKSFATEQN